MDPLSALRAIGALLVVLGLLAGFALLLRRHGHRLQAFGIAPAAANSRLAVIETRAIDVRTRLVLVRRDTKEHLILVSPTGATVIEGGITGP